MSAKFSFDIRSEDRRRDLPSRLLIGQRENESVRHIVLKLLAFALFHRERLQIEGDLHNDNIPFEPDLVELDYTLKPVLWIECGDCSAGKLHKLAVKVPDAEIWIIKASRAEAESLLAGMRKQELRENRYQILVFEGQMIEEMCGLIAYRNSLLWVRAEWDPPSLQFDLNGLWFDAEFLVLRH